MVAWRRLLTHRQYVGIGLLDLLGGVSSPHFENLDVLVVLQSAAKVLPLLMVPLLIPAGAPNDDEAFGFDIFRASQAGAVAAAAAAAGASSDDDGDSKQDGGGGAGDVSVEVGTQPLTLEMQPLNSSVEVSDA